MKYKPQRREVPLRCNLSPLPSRVTLTLDQDVLAVASTRRRGSDAYRSPGAECRLDTFSSGSTLTLLRVTAQLLRSLLHSLRSGGEGWDEDLDRAQDLPDIQLLALVNGLTRGARDAQVLRVIDDWYRRLKEARTGEVEEACEASPLADECDDEEPEESDDDTVEPMSAAA